MFKKAKVVPAPEVEVAKTAGEPKITVTKEWKCPGRIAVVSTELGVLITEGGESIFVDHKHCAALANALLQAAQ